MTLWAWIGSSASALYQDRVREVPVRSPGVEP
jgi:hypothetical protein